MNDIDLDYLINSFGMLCGIPLRCYEKDELKCSYFPAPLPKDPAEVCMKEIVSIKSHVGYYVSELFHYYGVVNSEELRIVVGPTSQVMAGDQELRELAFKAGVQKEDVQTFLSGMQSIARMPVESLLQLLCTINHILNGGEILSLSDIAIYEEEQESIKSNVEKRRTERVYEEPATQEKTHNTLALEQALMDTVRKGDSAALRSWLSMAPAVHGGTIAQSQLRQLRNTFIVTATLASRAAIRGGLKEDDAFAMSDGYIRRAELLESPAKIMNLQYHMLLEYTEQVEKLRLGSHASKLAADVSNYISHHLSEAITVEKMAEEFYMSRPYLSARFRKETGTTLTDFILHEKTEEAKRLLRYSDRSAAMISAYLGFSSTSHFSRVFKKYAGVTPREYRESH